MPVQLTTLAYRHQTCLLGKSKAPPQSPHGKSPQLPKPSGPSSNFWIQIIIPFLEGPGSGDILAPSSGFGKNTMLAKNQQKKNESPADLTVVFRFDCLWPKKLKQALFSTFSNYETSNVMSNRPRGHGISIMLMPMPLFCKPRYNKKTGRFSRKRCRPAIQIHPSCLFKRYSISLQHSDDRLLLTQNTLLQDGWQGNPPSNDVSCTSTDQG